MNRNEFLMKLYEAQLKHRDVILETIKEFEHHKRIDRNFSAALAQKGIRCWITDDKKLITTEHIAGEHEPIVEHYLPRQYSNPEPRGKGCWEQLRDEMNETNWLGKIAYVKNKMKHYDTELAQVKAVTDTVNTWEFHNFSTIELKRELNKMLRSTEDKHGAG